MEPYRYSRRLSVRVASIIALFAASASAEPPTNEARAEALFNTAKQLEKSGQSADACDLFAESNRLSPGVGVLLYGADCYEHIGRFATAWTYFRDAAKMASERNDEKRANVAQSRAQALEPKLNRLTLVSSPGVAHDGWQVELDGTALPLDHLNVPLALDPGDHPVLVKVPGRPARALQAHLDAATPNVSVQLDESEPAPAPVAVPTPVPPAPVPPTPLPAAAPPPAAASPIEPPAPPPRSPEPVPPSNGDGWRPWVEVGLVAATAAGIGFGSFFMLRRGHFIQEGPPADPTLTNQATTAATISFAGAGIALTSAFVLFFTTPSAKSQVGLTLAPVPLEGGAGALVRGSF
jgi:hypothetical protein